MENLFGNLARVLPAFNEEKIQEQIGGFVVSKCKKDEFEGVGITNFEFTGKISEFIGKKARTLRDSVLKG